MKKILWIFTSALLISSLFITTGCEDDPVDEPKIAPLVLITNQPAATVSGIDETVNFTVEVTKGTDPLNSLKITEDGTDVPANRLTISGIATANNPQLITGTDKDGLTWDITLNVHDAFDQRTYVVSATDEGGLSDSDQFTILVDDPGTPLDTTLIGILFNSENPDSGTGSLDLDDGLGSGISTDGAVPRDQAEIRDMGLDCTVPAPGLNWRRQIGSFNGTELRKVDLTQVENFTFENVTTKEQIEAAFDTGFTLTSDDVFNCGTGLPKATVDYVSDELLEGDLYVVKKGNIHYLIRIDQIGETAADNKDSYTISVKH